MKVLFLGCGGVPEEVVRLSQELPLSRFLTPANKTRQGTWFASKMGHPATLQAVKRNTLHFDDLWGIDLGTIAFGGALLLTIGYAAVYPRFRENRDHLIRRKESIGGMYAF